MKLRMALTTLALGLVAVACGPGNTQGLLRSGVDAQKSTLDRCYEKALERDETMAGIVRARLYIDRGSGSVRHVEILQSAGDEELNGCMEAALTGIQIGDAPKVDVSVAYEFELVPDGQGGGSVVEP